MTREQIVDAADELARKEGLERITIRAVCGALDVTAPTLYWHVDNKAGLVRALLDRVAARIPRPDDAEGSWFERLVAYELSSRDAFLEYPGIGTYLIREVPTEANVSNSLYIYRLMLEGGFDDLQSMSLFFATSTFLTGHLMMIDALRVQDGRLAPRGVADNMRRRAAALADRPELRAFAASVDGLDQAGSRGEFQQGVESLVRGAAAVAGLVVPESKPRLRPAVSPER